MPNKLSLASSPYLLQHANNPVDWFPWGEEALHKAKTEDKLMLISIGYAACHWCHVMEHESFEDEEVAALMNEHFVCIKVDREERPDIDKVYMDAVQLMTGRGGWPLNCVTLPDGRPIWGGTYFPKPQWMQILAQLADMKQNNMERVLYSAEGITQYMQELGKVEKVPDAGDYTLTHLENMLNGWMEQIDFKWGGRKVQANKFPLPMNLLCLLRAGHMGKHDQALEAVAVGLEKMAFGGIYDHLGGGFARYSVDPYWKVPHFEKMLYDNGQLVSLYAEAYLHQPLPLYEKVVEETLRFVQRELSSPAGGFFSSLDADSEGEEGKFYVWQYEEIESLLGEDAKLFADYYNVHPFGNWEGKNILFVLEGEAAFAERWKLDANAFHQKMAQGRKLLLAHRDQRQRPGLDDKILTSWNALMLKGCVDAYRVFQRQEYLDLALKNARFLSAHLTDGSKLYRNYKFDPEGKGQASIPGFLDDYAFLIEAYIALYEATFDEQWIRAAEKHLNYVWDAFFDPDTGMFFYTSGEGERLIKRHVESQDDVIPSSNASLAHSLHFLGLMLHKPDWVQHATQMLGNLKASLLKSPAWYAKWGQFMLKQVFPHYEVVITGPEAAAMRLALETPYYPNKIFAGGTTGTLPILEQRFTGKTTIYVCEGNTCQLPVHTPEEARKMIG